MTREMPRRHQTCTRPAPCVSAFQAIFFAVKVQKVQVLTPLYVHTGERVQNLHLLHLLHPTAPGLIRPALPTNNIDLDDLLPF